MKKALSILLLILMVVMLGGCKLLQKKEAPAEGGVSPQQEESTTQEKSEGKEESYSGTFKKMWALGIPLKCTVKKDDFSSTGYIKGKNYYAEVSQGGREGYLIMKDNCLWTWNKNEPQGFKMCFEPQEGEEDSWMDMEGAPPSDVEYHCSPTLVTDAKFNPPGNVQFMTMEEMMQGQGMTPQRGAEEGE